MYFEYEIKSETWYLHKEWNAWIRWDMATLYNNSVDLHIVYRNKANKRNPRETIRCPIKAFVKLQPFIELAQNQLAIEVLFNR